MVCTKPLSTNALTCSRKCSSTKKQAEYIEKWLAGDETGSNRNGSLKAFIRNYLLELAGHRCECGWDKKNPVTNTVILTIDHVDGDWTNNSFGNLKVLCYNCHSLTPTFGSLNRGNGSGPRGTYNRRASPIEVMEA